MNRQTIAGHAYLSGFQKSAQLIVWSVFAIMCLMLLWVAKENFLQPDISNAVLYPRSMRQIADFQLVDFNSNAFEKSRLIGKWSFLFVGYTMCPDICPNTLQQMQWAHDILEADGRLGEVQFIFVSVDPERDDLARLKSYTQYFNKDFIGVTGTPDEIELFGDAIGADYYKVNHPQEPRFYYVVHSAEIFLFNPEAQLYAMFPPPHKADLIISDFAILRGDNQFDLQHAGL